MNWYKRAKKETDKGIPLNERIVGLGFFGLNLFGLFYFLTHQIQDTGFFTDEFNIIGMIFLYGFFLMWMITSGLESILSQKLASRLFDTFGGIIFASISGLYLLIVFPFDFTLFTAVLPENLIWIFSWVTDDIAKVVLFLSFILHLIAAIVSPVIYKVVEINHSI